MVKYYSTIYYTTVNVNLDNIGKTHRFFQNWVHDTAFNKNDTNNSNAYSCLTNVSVTYYL